MKRDQCCNHDCEQGRECPRLGFLPPRADRRRGMTWFWRLFGWLMGNRRSGTDRRKNGGA